MSLKNVPSITTNEYEQVLDQAIRSSSNLMIFGHPGIGKTEIPYQRAALAGYDVVYVNLSVMSPPDFIGLPRIDPDGRVSFAAPKYLPVADFTEKPVVLLVDEVDKADSELTSPLLEVLQSHTIGGNKLRIQAIVLTGNMPDDHSYSKPISHALTNRCLTFQVESIFERWVAWARSAGINTMVTGFLWNNHEFFSPHSAGSDPLEYTKCSPRSWANVGRQLDLLPNDASIDFKTTIVSGFVGKEAAQKFRMWFEHYRTLDPAIEQVLATGQCKEELMSDMKFVLGTAVLGRCMAYHREFLMAKQIGKGQKHLQELSERVETAIRNSYTFIGTLPPNYQIGIVKSGFDAGVFRHYKNLSSDPAVRKTYTLLSEVVNSTR